MRLRRRSRSVFPPAPPLETERAEERFGQALAKARAAYRKISTAHPPPPGFVHPEWGENIREVESFFLERFDMAFLRHPRIDGTMVFTDRAAHESEWPIVEAWRPPETLRKYLGGGLNDRFLGGKLRSGTLINSTHQLYHLARFEKFRGEPVESAGSVVEFGGGYGNLARLCRNFGTLARYTVIDLPLFSCIQYVYLATAFGQEAVRLVEDPRGIPADGIINLVPISFLEEMHLEGDLFVSTWALSESPPTAYELVRGRKWFGARQILLAYNDGWKPWEGNDLEGALRESFERVVAEPIPFLPGNRYLLATGKIPAKNSE